MTAQDWVTIIGAISTPVLAIVAMVLRSRGRKATTTASVVVTAMDKLLAKMDDDEAEEVKEDITTTASMANVQETLDAILDAARKNGKL